MQEIIISTVDKIPGLKDRNKSGGRVNAAAAVQQFIDVLYPKETFTFG